MAHLQMMFPLKAPVVNIYHGFSSKQFWHNQMVDPKFDQNLLGFQPPHLTVTQTPDGSIVRRWSRRESRSWWRTTSATSKRWGPKRLMPLMPHLLDQYAWIWPKSLPGLKWWHRKNDGQPKKRMTAKFENPSANGGPFQWSTSFICVYTVYPLCLRKLAGIMLPWVRVWRKHHLCRWLQQKPGRRMDFFRESQEHHNGDVY